MFANPLYEDPYAQQNPTEQRNFATDDHMVDDEEEDDAALEEKFGKGHCLSKNRRDFEKYKERRRRKRMWKRKMI